MRTPTTIAAWMMLASCLGDRTGTRLDAADDASLDTVADTTTVDTTDVVPTPCGCAYGQECASPCMTPGDVCARDGYPDGSETRYCRPPAGVHEGCTNQFNEYYIPCAPDLACLVPDPDEDDTVSLCYDCAPQDFEVTGACAMAIGVFWDGSTCASYSGCGCTGADCDAPYESVAACLTAVGRACSALAP